MRYLCLILLLVSCTPGATYRLQEGNDIFKLGGNRDEQYTQGLKFSETAEGVERYVQQTIYTPLHKRLSNPLPTERPYAGYLSVGSKRKVNNDLYGVEVGIVGPHSYGEWSQSTVHRLLGQRVPRGWKHQLHDEPVILLTAQRAYPVNDYFKPLIGVNGGNLFSQVYLGGPLSFGSSGNNTHHDPIFPRLPASTKTSSRSKGAHQEIRDFSWSVFGGPYARAVARNMFLDGNTFQDSRRVKKYPFVLEGRVGCGVGYGRYEVTYQYMIQTREYRGEERGSSFGEIGISWRN